MKIISFVTAFLLENLCVYKGSPKKIKFEKIFVLNSEKYISDDFSALGYSTQLISFALAQAS